MNTIKIKNLQLGAGKPKICLPIVGKNIEEIKEQALAITGNPVDIIEWRADWYDEILNLSRLNEAIDEIKRITGEIPLLFTIRTTQEGGECTLSFEAYSKLLLNASQNPNVDAIDVEILISQESKIKYLIKELKKNTVVIASNHDFARTPDKGIIISRLQYMNRCGADICKIAVMPKSTRDVLTLMSATNEARDLINSPIITMSMGKYGLISRISGEIFGSSLTFGCTGRASAPGQIDAVELNSALEIIHNNL